MKLRNLLIVLSITFTSLAFSACTDESEAIVPQPVNVDAAAATIGNQTEPGDPMD